MAYSFFPNDFQNLPNLQDQLFLMKQKQAAILNEYFAGTEKARAAADARPMPTLIPPTGTVLPPPSSTFIPRIRNGMEDFRPAPRSIPPAGNLLPSPTLKPKPTDQSKPSETIKPRKGDIKEPDGGSMPSKEEIDKFASRLKADKEKKEADKASGGIAGSLGIPQEVPPKPRRGVTKSGKMITITSDKRPESRYIDGSGRSNVNRDKDGNVHITYGISGPPEGMSSGGEDYVEVDDDFDDKTSNPTEYYTTKSKQREADRATMFQRKPEDTPRYIQ